MADKPVTLHQLQPLTSRSSALELRALVLSSHLQPRRRRCLIWDDRATFDGGGDWERRYLCSSSMRCRRFHPSWCRANALSSNSSLRWKSRRILERHEEARCSFLPDRHHAVRAEHRLDWLDQPNLRPTDGKALSGLADQERDREMADDRRTDCDGNRRRDRSAAASSPAADGATAIVPDRRATRFRRSSTTAALPETPYKKLVGRETS